VCVRIPYVAMFLNRALKISEYVTGSWESMFRVPVFASLSSAVATGGAAIRVRVESTGKQSKNRSLTYDREDKYRNSVIVTTQNMILIGGNETRAGRTDCC
jgi:hypothetical protein